MEDNNTCKKADEIARIAKNASEESISARKYTEKTIDEVEKVICNILETKAREGYTQIHFSTENIFLKQEQIDELRKRFENHGYTFTYTTDTINNSDSIYIHASNNGGAICIPIEL